MPLTDAALKAAKPQDKPYRLWDKEGLYCEVSPAGGRLWRLKFRRNGVEKRLSLGRWPTVTLKMAREKALAARAALQEGRDPAAEKQAHKAAEKAAQSVTVETVGKWAEAWLTRMTGQKRRDGTPVWSADYAERVAERARMLKPIWHRPIAEVEPRELLAILQDVEQRSPELAHRLRNIAGKIWRHAVASSVASRDIAADLRDALVPLAVNHFPAVTDPAKVGGLMRAVRGYAGTPAVKTALELLALTALRPGEVRGLRWAEVDLGRKQIRIDANRMKMRRPHIVPLSRQALALLEAIQPLTGDGEYCFPGLRTSHRPISENALNGALRYAGVGADEMVSHGFRAMFSSLANEQGWDADLIEMALAHKDKNPIRATYNRRGETTRLAARATLMQRWADLLDELAAS